MIRFLLKLSTWFRKKAISRLHLDRFKKLSERDREAIAEKLKLIQSEASQILKIMSTYNPGATKEAIGFHLTYSKEDQPSVIIIDLVDGSHCYEIDPPGVTCCEPC